MTRSEFLEWRIKEWDPSCEILLVEKGGDYAAETDIFDNFNRHAQTLGLKPDQIWAVYAAKHWDAIMTWVRTGGKLQSEPILGRLRDLRNYLDLLAGSFGSKEDQETPCEESSPPQSS